MRRQNRNKGDGIKIIDKKLAGKFAGTQFVVLSLLMKICPAHVHILHMHMYLAGFSKTEFIMLHNTDPTLSMGEGIAVEGIIDPTQVCRRGVIYSASLTLRFSGDTWLDDSIPAEGIVRGPAPSHAWRINIVRK